MGLCTHFVIVVPIHPIENIRNRDISFRCELAIKSLSLSHNVNTPHAEHYLLHGVGAAAFFLGCARFAEKLSELKETGSSGATECRV